MQPYSLQVLDVALLPVYKVFPVQSVIISQQQWMQVYMQQN